MYVMHKKSNNELLTWKYLGFLVGLHFRLHPINTDKHSSNEAKPRQSLCFSRHGFKQCDLFETKDNKMKLSTNNWKIQCFVIFLSNINLIFGPRINLALNLFMILISYDPEPNETDEWDCDLKRILESRISDFWTSLIE